MQERFLVAEGASITYATLDVDRLEDLRIGRERKGILKHHLTVYRSVSGKPGQNRNRRPELYFTLIEPRPDAFNLFYYAQAGEFA